MEACIAAYKKNIQSKWQYLVNFCGDGDLVANLDIGDGNVDVDFAILFSQADEEILDNVAFGIFCS